MYGLFVNLYEPGLTAALYMLYIFHIILQVCKYWFDPRQGQRIFPLTSLSRPALGSTQPPVQWVPGVLSPGVKRGRGVMLATNPYLVPRS
jgi:hypothetical protein